MASTIALKPVPTITPAGKVLPLRGVAMKIVPAKEILHGIRLTPAFKKKERLTSSADLLTETGLCLFFLRNVENSRV
jgi:hypothetical protein